MEIEVDGKPPSTESHSYISKFFSLARKPLCGLLLRGEEIKVIPLAGGVGVHGLRLPIFIPLLDIDGKVE